MGLLQDSNQNLEPAESSGAATNLAASMLYPPDDDSEAYSLIRKARLEIDNSDEVLAISTCTAAIEAAQRDKKPLLESWALCMKATSLSAIGVRQEAFELAKTALEIAQSCKDKTMEARALFATSFVALETNDEDLAQSLLERCLDCARAADSDYDAFWALNNLSHIHGERALRLKDTDDKTALSHALQALFDTASEALKFAGRTKVWLHKCYALLNLATAEFVNKDYAKAHDLVAQYAKLARWNNGPRLMAYANLDEARLLHAEGNAETAIAMISDPEHLENLCKTADLKLRTHEMLVTFHKEQRSFEEAFHHLEQARDLENDIRTFQTTRHINMLHAKMEIEEARAKTERLQNEATALALRNQLLEQDQAALKRHAMQDALTGLGNRRAADIAIARQMQHVLETRIPFAVSYVDIDHFKQVNDQFGHQVGDKVLAAIGKLLKTHLRGRDEIFRFGGEEFVIIIADDTHRPAADICQRLRQKIAGFPWAEIDPALVITASFGVARWSGETDGNILLKRADKALYQAKEQGRNCVVLTK